jgi:hypothetical protein
MPRGREKLGVHQATEGAEQCTSKVLLLLCSDHTRDRQKLVPLLAFYVGLPAFKETCAHVRHLHTGPGGWRGERVCFSVSEEVATTEEYLLHLDLTGRET